MLAKGKVMTYVTIRTSASNYSAIVLNCANRRSSHNGSEVEKSAEQHVE